MTVALHEIKLSIFVEPHDPAQGLYIINHAAWLLVFEILYHT